MNREPAPRRPRHSRFDSRSARRRAHRSKGEFGLAAWAGWRSRGQCLRSIADLSLQMRSYRKDVRQEHEAACGHRLEREEAEGGKQDVASRGSAPAE